MQFRFALLSLRLLHTFSIFLSLDVCAYFFYDLLHRSPAVIRGGESFEDLLGSSLPCLSISPVLMRVEEIVEPSSALTSSTVITFTGFTPILARISLRSLPLLWVSILVTSASTSPVVTAGPKSPSSLAIS